MVPTCISESAYSPLKGQVGVAEDICEANVSCRQQRLSQSSPALDDLM